MGGLGNQLFQLFTTMAYGIRHQKPFIFPYSEKLAERNTYWNTFLNRLMMFTTAKSKFTYTKKELDQFFLYKEENFSFTEIPLHDGPLKIHGYFQTYKYFEKEYNTICSIIKIKEKQQEIYEEFPFLFQDKSHIISMHFRLGDYKSKQEYHNILPYEYYENALKQIPYNNNTRVLYFCEKEDNMYVENIIQKLGVFSNGQIEFVKVDDAIDDWKQLLLMSCCRDNIIANSSFSWWAAFLNTHSDKKIVYPYIWFGPALWFNNTIDMYPPSWEKIVF